MKFFRRLALGLFVLTFTHSCFVLEAREAAKDRAIALITGEEPSAPVKFGVEEIARVLREKGLKVETTTRLRPGSIQVVVGVRGDPHFGQIAESRDKVPEDQESYVVSVASPRLVVVEGSDAVGAMYGAFDLAEQIGWAEGHNFMPAIRSVVKSPYLAVRGINMFLTSPLPGVPKPHL